MTEVRSRRRTLLFLALTWNRYHKTKELIWKLKADFYIQFYWTLRRLKIYKFSKYSLSQ